MTSSSESDDDYVPKEPEQLSEEESADEETEAQYENEVEKKNKKRTAVQRNTKKKVRGDKEESKEESELVKEETKPEDEKKREDDLWAMFLDGTNTKPKCSNSKIETPAKTITKCDTALPTKNTSKDTNASTDSDKEKERRIFEFAGETIVVENNVIKEKIKTTETPPSVSKPVPSRSRGGGGLLNVLGQLNKKNQLSTLEKSKLDWDTFKKEEDIEAEIKSHNKGKQGYLERQDFLARADERQYEIERDLRLSRRSNR